MIRHTNITTAHKWLNVPEVAKYNTTDTLSTAGLARALSAELTRRGMAGFWEREVWPLVPAVLSVQARGLRFDADRATDMRHRMERELAKIDEGLIEADPTGALAQPTGKSPNGLGSPRKVASMLTALGLQPLKKTEMRGEPSIDQESLYQVLRTLRKRDEHLRPVLEDLFHRSRLRTVLQRYLRPPTDPDGRVRPTIKMGGTKSGRFAYADPALQQMPREVRPIYRPALGMVFVSADYSQLEARIAAVLAGDAAEIAAFNSGEDIHALTARELFGPSFDTMSPDARGAARDFAKTFRYGSILYGGNPETVRTKTFCPCPRCIARVPATLDMPRLRIVETTSRYFARHPQLLELRRDIEQAVRRDRAYTNPLGRKRPFYGPWTAVKREAYNWPIQSTAADIINRAMRRLHDEFAAPIVLQMHDSLMLEVPERLAGQWATRLSAVMSAPVPELAGTVFPVDVKVEAPWGETLRKIAA
jgi:DNA polymerase-1